MVLYNLHSTFAYFDNNSSNNNSNNNSTYHLVSTFHVPGIHLIYGGTKSLSSPISLIKTYPFIIIQFIVLQHSFQYLV